MSTAASAIVDQRAATEGKPSIVYRHAGDRALLVEYGDMDLDLTLNFFVLAVDRSLRERELGGLSEAAPAWESRRVGPGAELRLEFAQGPGFRMYVAVSGGVDGPPFFGSRSTYTMGALGGLEGRALRQGDRLALGEERADGDPRRLK
jgi:5-oxoprolinase (ATP-hydrolysing) subunit C